MKALKIGGAVVAVLVVVGVVLVVSGAGGALMFMAFTTFNKPSGEFSAADAVTAPDYADRINWAALPDMADPADLVPAGVTVQVQGKRPVDTFFIHPTGFLTSASWTSPMDVESGTEENTLWMMANQASAYNGCCNVYAPRYREANIFAYFGSEAERSAVLDFAYEDVKRAFEYYLDHYNEGRPFIIASHSQGSHHALRLLDEVIDATDLHERMVAAYLIGAVLIPVSPDWFAGLDHIGPCTNATEIGCVVHWDTMPEGANVMERTAPSLCTNPLTWRVDDELASADLNAGAVVPEGNYNITMGKSEDVPRGEVFDALDAPIPGHTSARCEAGTLFAEVQTDPRFAAMGSGPLQSYHGLDYALWYMNIRNNAELRASTFLSGMSSESGR